MVGGLRGDDRARRDVLQQAAWNGLDRVEVLEGPEPRLLVHLLKPADADLARDVLADPGRFRLTSDGQDAPPTVLAVPSADGTRMVLRLDRAGGFSPHRLHLDHPRIDRTFGSAPVDFKADCPDRLDCGPGPAPAEARPPPPAIDYEARDYASLRRLLLEQLRARVPDWCEEHEADLGVTLVELMAYAGDRLSYLQDAVANEAFLETARQRSSVRRHARLVDHAMHDGASARALVHVAVSAPVVLPAGSTVLTRLHDDPDLADAPPGLDAASAGTAADHAEAVFETLHDARLHPALCDAPALADRPPEQGIRIHAWGLHPCALAAGSTEAHLVDAGGLADALAPGDLLVLEERRSPTTGLEADADPAHRQAVRLTHVATDRDGVADTDLVHVRWHRDDALRFDLPLCGTSTDGRPYHDAGLALGNLVVADHGHRIPDEEHPGPTRPPHASLHRAHHVALRRGPLSQRVPLDHRDRPAAALFAMDPGTARPEVLVEPKPRDGDERERRRLGITPVWRHGDLLPARPLDRVVAAETDHDGRATLRFGDGRLGREPPLDRPLLATYRVGVGTRGNVGAESLAHVAPPPGAVVDAGLVLRVRNPLPAWGGTDPEDVESVRQAAPAAFRAVSRRAVTADDYARVAERLPEVHNARARFRWTGSWHTVFLHVDPAGRSDATPELLDRVRAWVERFAMTGYDVRVRGPVPVPLELSLHVCVEPDHLATDVEAAVLDVLTSGVRLDGEPGFFHPDRFTFGQPVHVSAVGAAVEAVPGVESVRVAALRRLGDDDGDELSLGRLPVGPLELVRLDNDPDRPENGRIHLTMEGSSA